MFLYGTLEERIPKNHPLRPVRSMTHAAVEALSSRFDELYSDSGRPAIPPEHLLRALLLQALYSIRSERMLVEQLECNLPFRWFVGLGMNEAAWNHPVLSKNRDRLLAGDVAREPFACVVEQARALRLLSDDQFTVDGTLTEANGRTEREAARVGVTLGADKALKINWTYVHRLVRELGLRDLATQFFSPGAGRLGDGPS